MEAKHGDVFHFTGMNGECPCRREVGERGGVKESITSVRVTGKCKTWVRQPDRFRLPVKHGLYDSTYITEETANAFHRREDCPLEGEGK